MSTPQVAPAVADALAQGRGVVALESTLIAHGLPRPRNLEVARELEALIAGEGAVAATVAVLDGVPTVGLRPQELERVALGADVVKLGVRDLPLAIAQGRTGATTVGSTVVLADRVGLRVFATGGLGGVHRGARETWDESADLGVLARTPVVVVCAGVKSILDVAATLERLETLGVRLAGYRTADFPGFYLHATGFPLDWCLETPEEVAAVVRAADELGVDRSALLLANPLPITGQLDPALHDRVLAKALEAARQAGITGKAVTPFVLDRFHTATGGASLEANVAIVRRNATLAARVAVALAGR